jgi:hypothetical protein
MWVDIEIKLLKALIGGECFLVDTIEIRKLIGKIMDSRAKSFSFNFSRNSIFVI